MGVYLRVGPTCTDSTYPHVGGSLFCGQGLAAAVVAIFVACVFVCVCVLRFCCARGREACMFAVVVLL